MAEIGSNFCNGHEKWPLENIRILVHFWKANATLNIALLPLIIKIRMINDRNGNVLWQTQ
jgi:hypothetical protein